MAKRGHKVWLAIRLDHVPGTFTRRQVIQRLIRSIEYLGDYELPQGWRITLAWRNRYDAPMKSGPWTEVMTESGGARGPGWDQLVLAYLRSLLRAPAPTERGRQTYQREAATVNELYDREIERRGQLPAYQDPKLRRAMETILNTERRSELTKLRRKYGIREDG